MSWTDDRVALLTKLWKEGKTAKEIAEALGEGVTRNAVIGKAHRLNLSGRASPIQKNAAQKTKLKSAAYSPDKSSIKSSAQSDTKPASKPSGASGISSQKTAKAKTPPKMPAPANRNDMQPKKAPEGGVQLQDLKDRMCKWPHGDPQESDFHFCGGPSVPGLPYCEEHVKAAYQTNKKSKILNPEAFENNNKDNDEDEQEQLA